MDINNDKQVALGNEFQQLLSGEYGFSYKMYDIITCKVVAVYKNLDYAVVSADGLKGESFVKLSEFVENYRKIDVKVGDEYQFFVVSIDKGEQAVLLSKSMVNIERSWHRLKNSMETGEAVDGVIFQKMKGGYGVDFDGGYTFRTWLNITIYVIRLYKTICTISAYIISK
jgi:small subunit ribosomal protein S1